MLGYSAVCAVRRKHKSSFAASIGLVLRNTIFSPTDHRSASCGCRIPTVVSSLSSASISSQSERKQQYSSVPRAYGRNDVSSNNVKHRTRRNIIIHQYDARRTCLASLRQWRRSYEATSSPSDPYSATELALDSVVKIFTVSSSPNYFLPWQNKSQRETMGSGFVISGKRILTNAHVVADHTFVLVRRHGSPIKYRASVQAVGHECDLALLVVESEEFWEGMTFLELGVVPFLQETVAVVGYPQGGDNISVTKGVVSRVEPTQYVHGATQLMAIQIDAAINPGNSGGPAIMGDKVVGVAFQNLSGAENIGYIIPVPVIKHFIAGVEEKGKYAGFCSLGLSCQPTENVQLRTHFQMHPGMTGVLVSKIHPLSDAHKVLQKDDIILGFDGVPIANDGTVAASGSSSSVR